MQYLKFKEPKNNKIDIFLPEKIIKIIYKIKLYGGIPYLVGGAVIDILCNTEPKDYDIEVFHLSYANLINILKEFGEPDLIGNKFGIVKLKADGLDLEFSIPRRESRYGLKHQDFNIELVENLSIEEAARRRDFTVNTIYAELPLGNITDPYNGLRDLKHGLLSHVNKSTFVEDGLRVFRGIQIIGRKLKDSSLNLNYLVKNMFMLGDLKNVPGEAVFGELDKLFMKAESFTTAAEYMEQTYLLDFFPELKAMQNTPQSKKWHPEGDVWEHTKLVMDQAFEYRDEVPKEWRQAFMWGMFLHDIGKPITVNSETLSCYGHDKAGGKIAKEFLEHLKAPKKLTDMVVQIVTGHMRPRQLVQGKCKMGSWRKLQNVCPLNILAYVSMSDSDGRGFSPKGKDGEYKDILEAWNKLDCPASIINPILLGRHLIERGHTPGKKFGVILGVAYKYQIKTGETDIKRLYKLGIDQSHEAGNK